jgi:hypothetical protein
MEFLRVVLVPSIQEIEREDISAYWSKSGRVENWIGTLYFALGLLHTIAYFGSLQKLTSLL